MHGPHVGVPEHIEEDHWPENRLFQEHTHALTHLPTHQHHHLLLGQGQGHHVGVPLPLPLGAFGGELQHAHAHAPSPVPGPFGSAAAPAATVPFGGSSAGSSTSILPLA